MRRGEAGAAPAMIEAACRGVSTRGLSLISDPGVEAVGNTRARLFHLAALVLSRHSARVSISLPGARQQQPIRVRARQSAAAEQYCIRTWPRIGTDIGGVSNGP